MIARLSALLPELASAVRRFPEATLAAIGCTVLALIESDAESTWSQEHLTLAAIFPAMLGVGMWAQHRNIAPLARAAASVSIAAAIALLVFFRFSADVSLPLLFAFVLVLPSLAAHTRQKDNASFWIYNHDLWLGFAMAVIGGVLFALSLTAILATLSSLFQIAIPTLTYARANAIAANLVAPLIWLTLVPRAMDGGTASVIDTSQTSSRAIALLVKFILVPVLLVYTAIIYVYAAKIAIDGALPKGQIGWMVLAYGATGTITLLAAYPSRDAGGVFVAAFYKSWFALVLLPVALLFLAVFTRTGEYGITGPRYLVILAGLWLVALAALFGFRREDKRDLRVIVASFAAFVAFAMAGPWGAVGSTTQLLAADFHAIAGSSSAFANGQFQADRLQDGQRDRLVSIVKYLGENGRLDRLFPLIANVPAAKLIDIAPAKTERERQVQAVKFAQFIGLPTHAMTHAGPAHFSFYASRPVVLGVKGQVAGPLVLTPGAQFDDAATLTLNDTAGQPVTVTLTRSKLTVRLATDRSVVFDAVAIAGAMKDSQAKAIEGNLEPVHLNAHDGARPVHVIVTGGYGTTTQTSATLTNLSFWLTWGQ